MRFVMRETFMVREPEGKRQFKIIIKEMLWGLD
jgi:hypothetical protein